MRFDFTNIALLLIAVLLSIICIVGVYINRRKRATLENRLGDRERLSPQSICEQFFRDLPQEHVEDVLREIASTLEVPLGLLRPNDRFDVELTYEGVFGYDGRMESLAAIFRKHMTRRGLPQVIIYPETVGGVVRAIVPARQRTEN